MSADEIISRAEANAPPPGEPDAMVAAACDPARASRDLLHLDMLFPHSPVRRTLMRLLRWPLEPLLGISKLNRIFHRFQAEGAELPASERAFRALDIRLDYNAEALAAIPDSGPVIVVANHPFGGIEGVALWHLLAGVRPDLRFMVNFLLRPIFADDPQALYVDPFERDGAAARNSSPMRQTLASLRDGHMLVVFPAGAVSYPQPPDGRIVDPPWDPTIGRLAQRTGATVIPIYIHGQNSALFQTLGRLHPKLRTALLVRELVNKQGRTLRLRIGQPIPPAQLKDKDPAAALSYLRSRVYLQAHRLTADCSAPRPASAPPAAAPTTPRAAKAMSPADPVPLADPVPADEMAAELAALPPERLLIASGRMQVWFTRRRETPRILEEIGRAREETFRAAGEGTGQPRDLDRFDDSYDQLLLWDAEDRRVAGGYRIGRLADILPGQGVDGLYTSTLYDFRPDILTALQDAGLELGRSFVTLDYQKKHNSLLLLWQAIGRYVGQRPQGCILFGTVSFSADYMPISHRLAVAFLNATDHLSALARHVHSRRPVETASLGHVAPDLRGIAIDIGDLTAIIADLEVDQKGVPVLLRQYLKLGGKVLGFNRDPDFGNTLDVLMMVDLRLTNQRLLARYMGEDAYSAFTAVHAAPVT